MIPSLELELGPGLTLLTGETGAGKSILIDSLGLLLGDRATAEIVRTGEGRAVVEAVVELDGAEALLEPHGLPVEGDEVVLRREVQTEGRARATVNGALVPVSLLRELAPHVATIHGQHEPQGLLEPARHLDLLDAFAGIADTVQLRERYWALRDVEDELERDRLANAGHLAELASEAYALLYDDEGAALERLGQVYKRVAGLAEIDPAFRPHAEGQAGLTAQLQELALLLRDYQEHLEVAPGRLDQVEARLALIERLKKKYGKTVVEVIAFGESCRRQLESLDDPAAHEARLRKERAARAAAYLERAREVSRRRRESARELEKAVLVELRELAMEKTRFRVAFAPEEPGGDEDSSGWGERGLERAEFLLSPNPGEELRPLAKIASGGELSRIMLALKSAVHGEARGGTLVFDEVDAGIGGRVAEVVGRKLKGVAREHQVLCVTHLPQIAALADEHLVVRKHVEKGRTMTTVDRLDGASRVEEIARMLGGAVVTDTAREHAREMLNQKVSRRG